MKYVRLVSFMYFIKVTILIAYLNWRLYLFEILHGVLDLFYYKIIVPFWPYARAIYCIHSRIRCIIETERVEIKNFGLFLLNKQNVRDELRARVMTKNLYMYLRRSSNIKIIYAIFPTIKMIYHSVMITLRASWRCNYIAHNNVIVPGKYLGKQKRIPPQKISALKLFILKILIFANTKTRNENLSINFIP